MRTLLRSLRDDESAAPAVEYGLLAALIAIGLIIGLRALGTDVAALFTRTGTTVQNAGT